MFGKINKSSSLWPIERSSSQTRGCFGIDDTVPLSLNMTSPWDNTSLININKNFKIKNKQKLNEK